jgi:hypothetical protein
VQNNYQIRELAMLVAGSVGLILGHVNLTIAPEPPLVRNYRCSNDKLFETLGVRPSRGVLEAVDSMVGMYGKLDAPAFANPRYYNLDWMVLLNEVHAGLRPFDYVLRRDEPARWSE